MVVTDRTGGRATSLYLFIIYLSTSLSPEPEVPRCQGSLHKTTYICLFRSYHRGGYYTHHLQSHTQLAFTKNLPAFPLNWAFHEFDFF